MIKPIRIINLIIFLFLTFSVGLFAQKYGHLNSGNLLAAMPKTKQAESKLSAYQKELGAVTDQLQTTLDKKAKAFEAEYLEGTLSKIIAEQRYAELQKEQESILKRRQEDEQKVLKKREDLVRPIFTDVENAIKAVGKENGYTFIFDTSIFNAVLFVEESDDVTNLVKKKLGL